MPLTISSNPSGSGTFTVQNPASASNRTLTLPDATTELVGTDATQTLTNKTIAGGAITRATAVASTSGTSIEFTGIPSWAKKVTVMLSGVSTTGTASMQISLGDSGGIEFSGYSGVAAISGGGGTAQTLLSGSFLIYDNAGAASNVYSGSLILTNLTGNTWVAQGVFGDSANAGLSWVGGSKTLSDVLDRIRITMNGVDTFDAGQINVMWEG